MTTEPPTPLARPPRPGPAFRRAALGLPPDPGDGLPSAGGPAPAPRRESLSESLARIPDLQPVESSTATGEAGAAGVAVSAHGSRQPAEARQEETPAPRPSDDALGGVGRGLRARASRLLNGPIPDLAFESPAPEAPSGDQAMPAQQPVDDSPAATPGGGIEAPSGEPILFEDDDEALFWSVESVLPPRAESDTAELRQVQAAAPAIGDLMPAPNGLRSRGRAALDGSIPSLARVQRGSPEPSSVVDPVVGPDPSPASRRVAPSRTRAARPVAWWRRVGFAAVVLALVTAIPVLGKVGYGLVTQSTDGRFSTSVKSPSDPGYEELVDSTPTELVIQTDAQGVPVAATLLSLSGVSGGGSVIFVPLETAVRKPAYGVDRLSRAYEVLKARPADGRKQLAVQVGSLLNVGIDGVVVLDDRGWDQLVAPVAPLTIDNPDPIEAAGLSVPSGVVQLAAAQVGPYLAARLGDESALNRLNRQELVWTAWLKAVAASGRDDVVPGETASGIGLFTRTLARGVVNYATLPTTPADDGTGRLVVDDAALGDLVLGAVPAPDPAYPGSRATVRVLNGVAPGPIPDEILQTIVRVQGSLSIVGNGPSFNRSGTTITYADPAKKGFAVLLQAAFGTGTVRFDREADDSVDLTVILGHDVIDGASATTTTPALDLGTETSVDDGSTTSTTGGP